VPTTLNEPGWANTTVISTDVVARIKAITRTSDGTLLLAGSSQLAHTLIDADVIDEYQLYIHPVNGLDLGLTLY
jgi:dihydrofolate reductase